MPVTAYHPTDTMPHWLERAWMDRYLDRELDDGERDWFEAYLLDRPLLVEELEADEAVRTVASSLPTEAADQTPMSAPASTGGQRPKLRWLTLAAAAAITGAVVSAALLYRPAAPIESAYAALLDVSRSDADGSPVVLKAGATNVLSIAFAPEVTAAWWEAQGNKGKVSIAIDPSGFGTLVVHAAKAPGLTGVLTFKQGDVIYRRDVSLRVE